MTTVDTFVYLFKSDTKGASDDANKLDQQISQLAAKGDKRTEKEEKQLKELRKQRVAYTQDLRDQTKLIDKQAESTDKLADSLVSVGVSAIAAFAGFEGIKSIASDALNLNLNLQQTRALTGQNAEEIQAWDQAFERLGAPGGAFTKWFTTYSQYLQRTGQDTKQILPFLRSLSDEIKNLPEDQGRQRFQQAAQAFGLPQEFYLALREGGAALDDLIQTQEKFIKANKASEDSTRSFVASLQNLGSSLVGLFSRILGPLTGFQTSWNNILATLISGNFSAGSLISAALTGFKGQSNPDNGNNASKVLPLISQYESGNRNVLNASGPGGTPASTASGYYQITNGTWQDFAPKAGVSLKQYPTAMSAPQDVQQKVAALLYNQRGIEPWSSDTRLLAALGKDTVAQADSSSFNAPTAGGGGSISIGKVEVHTQAKDAPGIADAIVSELHRAYRSVVSNWDDGVVK